MPQKDLVLATVPYTESDCPLPAIPILKSIALKAGWDCIALDLNVKYCNQIEKQYHKNLILDFLYNEVYHPAIEDELFDMFDSMSNEILKYNPKLVGLSLFSYACQVSAKYLCMSIKKKSPHVKIILGGSGIFENVLGDDRYLQNLRQMKLIDHHIVGDAEQSFYDFLVGDKESTGIDSNDWKELDNKFLNNNPMPNYDDYDFNQYAVPSISIVGSRGCVRRCTFCNDIVHWKKFSFRDGQNIFNEMLHQHEKYGINTFSFADALTNGNVREFKTLLNLLSSHNKNFSDKKLRWEGQFIFRPKNQFTEEDWKLLSESGPLTLSVGIESLSERIRFDMGKKFNQESLEFNLEMALKYNIRISGMMIVGYPTETIEDINYAKSWLDQNSKFKDVLSFSWGGTMSILPGTYLDNNREKYNLDIFGPPWQNWINTETGSNPQQRATWLADLRKHAESIGFRSTDNNENKMVMHMILNDER